MGAFTRQIAADYGADQAARVESSISELGHIDLRRGAQAIILQTVERAVMSPLRGAVSVPPAVAFLSALVLYVRSVRCAPSHSTCAALLAGAGVLPAVSGDQIRIYRTGLRAGEDLELFHC